MATQDTIDQTGGSSQLIPATEDPWLHDLGLRVLSCRVEGDKGSQEEEPNNNVPWAVTSTVTILSEDCKFYFY